MFDILIAVLNVQLSNMYCISFDVQVTSLDVESTAVHICEVQGPFD